MSIKFENIEVVGWEHAIHGMRNALESWEKSDSGQGCSVDFVDRVCFECDRFNNEYEYEYGMCVGRNKKFAIGPNDLDLMKRLRNAGTDHRKFMRMITVYADITAPLYWWKEFDTYKVGTVANSCSTMHKIAAKEFTIDDFSHEHLIDEWIECNRIANNSLKEMTIPKAILERIIFALNVVRDKYLETKDKKYWWQMIQLLPSSYNQKRTVMMNYEVLANIYKSRKNHKLDEWAEHNFDGSLADYLKLRGSDALNQHPYGFCDWIKTLPYSELITGNTESKKENVDKN